jgi:hypothetical protein
MFEVMFWIVGAFIVLLIVFCAGYLIACRELGKEVRFYKDVVANQGTTISGYMQEIDRMQRVMKGD